MNPTMKKVIPRKKATYEMMWIKCSISTAIGVMVTSVSVMTLAIRPMKVLSPTLITRPRPVPDLIRVP